MYFLLIVLLLAAGGLMARRGLLRKDRWLAMLGVTLIGTTLVLFGVLSLWGEGLWFHALGYGDRFWTFLTAQSALLIGGTIIGLTLALLLNLPLHSRQPRLFPWTLLAGGIVGAVWGLDAWQPTLLFINRVEAGVSEPVLGLDAGFYLFTLPFLDAVHDLLLWVVLVSAVAALGAMVLEAQQGRKADPDGGAGNWHPLTVVSAAAGLTLGLSALLAVFRLLYSEWGIVAGPGWTDVHVRLPGYLVLAVATLVLGLLPLIGPARRWIAGRIESRLAVRRTLLLTTAAAWTATPWPTTTGRLWFRPGKCRRTISRCRVRPSSTGVSSVPTDTA